MISKIDTTLAKSRNQDTLTTTRTIPVKSGQLGCLQRSLSHSLLIIASVLPNRLLIERITLP